MNNSRIAIESLAFEEPVDKKPALRQKEQEVLAVIEALQAIIASSYWKVLQAGFDKELEGLRNRLAREKDTVEIFRLQGQIERAEKLDLEKNLLSKRNELLNIRNQINA